MYEFKRERHRRIWRALEAFDADFLTRARCYFGGGTRIAIALGEYRESADIDFLCADRAGYTLLRNTISQHSLGSILNTALPLLRDVRADRYGIRTFLDIDGQPIKFEIISEGRGVPLNADANSGTPVPALDDVSCFTEQFLANADCWADTSVFSRDIIDLAFMIKRWDPQAALVGLDQACHVYGDVVVSSLTKAISKMKHDKAYYKRCISALTVSDSSSLREGLDTLVQLLVDFKDDRQMVPSTHADEFPRP